MAERSKVQRGTKSWDIVLAGLAAAVLPMVTWLLAGLDKQDAPGRWKLENALNTKMWADIEQKGQPSKWITLRALRVVKAMEEAR
jgi:hypothetical protein